LILLPLQFNQVCVYFVVVIVHPKNTIPYLSMHLHVGTAARPTISEHPRVLASPLPQNCHAFALSLCLSRCLNSLPMNKIQIHASLHRNLPEIECSFLKAWMICSFLNLGLAFCSFALSDIRSNSVVSS
jgi:hypothetical protein